MVDADEMFASAAETGDSAYLLSPRLQIVRVNAAFKRFAEANGGESILAELEGYSVLEATSAALREFYQRQFAQAARTGNRWEWDYECSSPTRYRQFRMLVYPSNDGCLVVVNSLRVESPHQRAALPPDDALYRVGGILKMCSHCRRVQNARLQSWHWVPAYLEGSQTDVSHGLCGPCAAFYWGSTALEAH